MRKDAQFTRMGVVLLILGALLFASRSVQGALPRHASADWPLFGGTYDNTRFSPLAQINTASVAHLRLAWHRDEGFGQFTWETFPPVVGGRMYLTTNTDEVWALNAATGAAIWKYAPRINFLEALAAGGAGRPTNRGVAVAVAGCTS